MNVSADELSVVAAGGERSDMGVKALIFDTFGTVVDWRGSIIKEGNAWGKAKGINIDWARFADRWRSGYLPAMDQVRKGELPWTKLDDLHRMLLEDLLKEFKIEGLSEEEKDHWNRVWHRLKPWADSVAGLARLKKKYTIAPCSNGNVALLNDWIWHRKWVRSAGRRSRRHALIQKYRRYHRPIVSAQKLTQCAYSSNSLLRHGLWRVAC